MKLDGNFNKSCQSVHLLVQSYHFLENADTNNFTSSEMKFVWL